jgi:hypothetical protein
MIIFINGLLDKSKIHVAKDRKVGPFDTEHKFSKYTENGERTLLLIIALMMIMFMEVMMMMAISMMDDCHATGTALLDYQKQALDKNIKQALAVHRREVKAEKKAAKLALNLPKTSSKRNVGERY